MYGPISEDATISKQQARGRELKLMAEQLVILKECEWQEIVRKTEQDEQQEEDNRGSEWGSSGVPRREKLGPEGAGRKAEAELGPRFSSPWSGQLRRRPSRFMNSPRPPTTGLALPVPYRSSQLPLSLSFSISNVYINHLSHSRPAVPLPPSLPC